MSFQLKTTLGIALIQGILLIGLIAHSLNFLYSSNENELAKRATTTATLLAAVARDAVISTDVASLHSLVRSLLTNPDIVYARILDDRGVLAQGGDSWALGRDFVPDQGVDQDHNGVFDTQATIHVAGHTLGSVQLGISLAPMQKVYQEARRESALIATLAIVLVALFSILLGHYLTRQLKLLREAARAISEHGAGVQLPVKGRDELAETTRAFNQMSARLKTSHSELSYALSRYRLLSDELRRSEQRYRELFEHNQEVGLITEPQCGQIIDANDAAIAYYGFPRAELLDKRLSDINLLPEEEIARRNEVAKQGKNNHFSCRHRLASGEIREVEVFVGPVRIEGQERFYWTVHDVTERHQAESKLRLYATFFKHAAEAIVVSNADNHIMAVNPAFTRITGYSEDEVLGKNPNILSSGRHEVKFYQVLWSSLQDHGFWQGEIWNRRKGGDIYPEWLSLVAIQDDQGQVAQYMAIFSDITQRKETEKKIIHQANFDALTGLPNRSLFHDRLNQILRRAHRSDSRVALMFIDLDRFKWVNDTLGHAMGDRLLCEVAERLNGCVRESDTVARLGGDEFTVILPDVSDPTDIERVARTILEQLSAPFRLEGQDVYISSSIGIGIYPQDAKQMEELIRHADNAMYHAKAAGRNDYRFFTEEMNKEATRRMQIQSDLRLALERQEFELHYQPIVNMGDGLVLGAEALLRWHHPQRGDIPPADFIPLAEESGLIAPIERWVMQTACRQARAWQDDGLGLFVSVNISSPLCKSQDCKLTIIKVLDELGLKPSNLKLEITERLMMEDTQTIIETLKGLRAHGVRLSVDDFGTGYSSLSYLKRFPIHTLKIDRAFIQGLPDDRDDVALVKAITAMAHSLGLQVIAEGVETAEQYEVLQHSGCDMVQGYFCSPPLPNEAFVPLILGHLGQSLLPDAQDAR